MQDPEKVKCAGVNLEVYDRDAGYETVGDCQCIEG